MHFHVLDKLRWANTTSETTTILPVSIDDTSCLILYAYICVYCNLKITVQGGSTYELSGTNQQSPEPWQSLRIELESDIDVELFRSTTNGSSAGQWAIDVRKCPPTLANKSKYLGVDLCFFSLKLCSNLRSVFGRQCRTRSKLDMRSWNTRS